MKLLKKYKLLKQITLPRGTKQKNNLLHYHILKNLDGR